MSIQLISELDSIHRALSDIDKRLLVVATELAEALKPSHNISVMPCHEHQAGWACELGLGGDCKDEVCKLSVARA